MMDFFVFLDRDYSASMGAGWVFSASRAWTARLISRSQTRTVPARAVLMKLISTASPYCSGSRRWCGMDVDFVVLTAS